MEYTEIVQNCYGITIPASGAIEYRIETTIGDPGELLQAQIFVYNIISESDPTKDTFNRVANPQDMQNLLINRDDAIAADLTEYLRSDSSLTYADITVAVLAKAALTTRINQLIRDWITYRDAFTEFTGTTRLYPTADPDLEASLETAYADAKKARIAAEADLEAADTALTTAKADVDTALTLSGVTESALTFSTAIRTDFGIYQGYVNTYGTEGATGTGYRKGTVEPLLNTYAGTASTNYSQASTNLTTKRTAVETATTAKAEAASALAAAQAAEDAALAAVLGVCPNFDPASV